MADSNNKNNNDPYQDALFDMDSSTQEERKENVEEDEISSYEKSAENYETGNDKPFIENKLKFGAVIVVGSLIGIGGAIGYDMWDRDRQASGELQSITESRSDLVAINTDVMEYGNNGDSYALGLGSDGNYPQHGALVFGNDNGEYNYTVDLFIDYSNTRSRDFFFANNTMLRGLVESSEVQLRLHPVPTERSAYSAYAAEAMAQAFHRHPDSAWEVNIALLQLLDDVQELEEPTRADMLEMIESELGRHLDISDIDTDLIMEAMFADWITTNATHPMLSAGAAPPLVYSNGQLIDPDLYYMPEDLRENILAPSEQDFTDSDILEGLDFDEEDMIDQQSNENNEFSELEDFDDSDIDEEIDLTETEQEEE